MILFTRDLRAQGIQEHEIRARVRQGKLVRLRRGAYVLADDTLTPEARHLLTVQATWPGLCPGACLSHHTAGVIHGLPVPRHLLGPVHITRAGRGGTSRSGLQLHRSTIPAEQRVSTAYGEATSLGRTVVDLARTLPPIHGVAIADAALARGLARAEVETAVAAQRSSGNLQAREVMRLADGRSESVGESHSRWLMAELGLPAPELQHQFFDEAGKFVARVDFWWPDFGLVGEFDGERKYLRTANPGQSTEQVVLAEKRREEALRRLGVWVIRWIWSELDDRDTFKRLIVNGIEFASRTRRT